MELKTSKLKRKTAKIWLWLVLLALVLICFVSVLMLLNYGDNSVVLYLFGGLMILSAVLFFPYLIFLTRGLELLSTQKVFYSEKNLLFYYSRRDGNTTEIGQLHFYDKKLSATKVRKNKLFISVKGKFQTKTEGYAVLDIQNPDDEPTKLTFDEQVGLIYLDDSYLKEKTVRIMRVFDKEEEELLLKLLSGKSEEKLVEAEQMEAEEVEEFFEEKVEEETEETTEIVEEETAEDTEKTADVK